MKRFLAAAAAAATTLPLLLVAGATPAAAANCRSAYAPGNYALRISPATLVVNRGAIVRLTSRLIKPGLECGNERIGFYTRPRGGTVFRLAVGQTSNSRGLVDASFTVRDDFRWYTNFNINANTPGARSSSGLVQVRR